MKLSYTAITNDDLKKGICLKQMTKS